MDRDTALENQHHPHKGRFCLTKPRWSCEGVDTWIRCSDLPGFPKTFPVFFTGSSEVPWDQRFGPCPWLKEEGTKTRVPGCTGT